MQWLECAFLRACDFPIPGGPIGRHFLKTTAKYEILGHDVCRGSRQTWHKVSGTGANRSCLFLDKFGYRRREKAVILKWYGNQTLMIEAEPRSFRAALRLSLFWTFPWCLSQLAVVLYYVACRFRMSSGMYVSQA